MKKNLNILASSLMILLLFASCKKKDLNSGSEFPKVIFENDYPAAKAEAEKQGRKIFVDYYAVWCSKCADFKENTLNDTNVVKYIESNYVAVALDAEKEGEDMYKATGANGYPLLAIYDTDGNLIAKSQGVMNSTDFIAWLEKNK